MSDTVAGIGPGAWDSGRLAREQETHANANRYTAVVYRLYTENKHGIVSTVARYFDGATVFPADGLWRDTTEDSVVIEIVASRADLQRIVNLAGDIKVRNNQSSVLVTWQAVSRLDV